MQQLYLNSSTKAGTFGIFDRVESFSSLLILIKKVALNAGSSKHGKADLAARGSN